MRFRVCIVVLTAWLLCGCDVTSDTQQAQRRGELIVGNNAEPQSFDPHIATAVSDFKIINAVMEGLVRGDEKDDTQVHPGVAESWECSADAKQWTFYLRKDAVWSDGTPLTAHDFVYAYHRLLHPSFGGRYADMLYPLQNAEAYNKNQRAYLLARNVLEQENLPIEDYSDSAMRESCQPPHILQKVTDRVERDKAEGQPDLWSIARVGVQALDDHTLRLTLHVPMPHLPLLLLHPTWFPVPQHALESYGGMLDRHARWTRPGHAVGNGPFTITQHRYNDYVLVTKNPRYRAADQVPLRAVRFLPIVNGFTETRMFFNNQLHITNNVPPEMIPYAKQHGGEAFCQDAYYATVFYRLNTTKAPLNDPQVRRALSLALDRQTLVQQVAGGAGEACYGFTPPGLGYQTPHGVDFDPQQARELLARAGYPNGEGFPRLELMTTSREVQKTTAEAIQAMWKQHLGIHVEIRSSEWTAYKVAQNNMQYDISSSSWSGDYPDAAGFLDLWTRDAGNNNTGWSSPDYERLLKASRNANNTEERQALLAQAEQIMLESAPIIPLYWTKRSYLKQPQVQGWHPLLLDNHLFEKISFGNQPVAPEHD